MAGWLRRTEFMTKREKPTPTTGLGIAFRSQLEHLVHRVRVHARQAEGEPADERRQQRIKERRRQHAGLRLADQLFGLQLDRRSVYDHENHLC